MSHSTTVAYYFYCIFSPTSVIRTDRSLNWIHTHTRACIHSEIFCNTRSVQCPSSQRRTTVVPALTCVSSTKCRIVKRVKCRHAEMHFEITCASVCPRVRKPDCRETRRLPRVVVRCFHIWTTTLQCTYTVVVGVQTKLVRKKDFYPCSESIRYAFDDLYTHTSTNVECCWKLCNSSPLPPIDRNKKYVYQGLTQIQVRRPTNFNILHKLCQL